VVIYIHPSHYQVYFKNLVKIQIRCRRISSFERAGGLYVKFPIVELMSCSFKIELKWVFTCKKSLIHVNNTQCFCKLCWIKWKHISYVIYLVLLSPMLHWLQKDIDGMHSFYDVCNVDFSFHILWMIVILSSSLS
jgi:hypothetical protein